MAHGYTRINTDQDRLSYAVLGAAYEVANQLGGGFLEKVYERAMVKELARRGVKVQAQVPLKV